jgi:hypothetical protein
MLPKSVENDTFGYVLESRMMCIVTDAARKTAVDSCTFEVEALSLRGFAGRNNQQEHDEC